MTFATEIVQGYRLALQYLWNVHYWRDERFRDWESVRDFEKLRAVLFRGLIARRLEPLAESSDSEQAIFGSTYRVVPSFQTGQLPTMFVNLQSANDPNLNWEHLSGPFVSEKLKLGLIDLFDWNTRGWRDFRYYKVQIMHFDDRPELIGREGLVDVLDADVLWNVND